jgi:hypothetical protein
VLPVPNSLEILQILVSHLQTWTKTLDEDSYGIEWAELILWMLAIRGIAAINKPERAWFASCLANIVSKLNLSQAYTESILNTFLWLKSVCGPGGRQLWCEAVNISEL